MKNGDRKKKWKGQKRQNMVEGDKEKMRGNAAGKEILHSFHFNILTCCPLDCVWQFCRYTQL